MLLLRLNNPWPLNACDSSSLKELCEALLRCCFGLHQTVGDSRLLSRSGSPAMPRPKVHPSQRRRAAEACRFCRANKKRCSGTVPCINCRRKGKADSCCIPHRRQSIASGAAAPTSFPSDSFQSNLKSPTDNGLERASARGDQDHPSLADQADLNSSPTARPIPPHVGYELHSRMLLNSRGERGESCFFTLKTFSMVH